VLDRETGDQADELAARQRDGAAVVAGGVPRDREHGLKQRERAPFGPRVGGVVRPRRLEQQRHAGICGEGGADDQVHLGA
jgi:hypothetical protein